MDNQNDMMKDGFYCPSCGKKNTNNHNYCIFCGCTFNLDEAGNISQIYQASFNSDQQLPNYSQQMMNGQQNYQQYNSVNGKKEQKKYGLLVWAGFLSLILYFSSVPIMQLFIVLLFIYYSKKENPRILGFILRAIGIFFLSAVALLLILLCSCLGLL